MGKGDSTSEKHRHHVIEQGIALLERQPARCDNARNSLQGRRQNEGETIKVSGSRCPRGKGRRH
jgi:hypothetical protein